MPTMAELIKFLPEKSAQADRLPEPLTSASLRPVPVGRLRRIGLLGTLQAQIAAAYLDGPTGTVMRDRFEFDSPLGILGRIADWLFLASYMRRFLVRRNAVLKQLAESTEGSRYLERIYQHSQP